MTTHKQRDSDILLQAIVAWVGKDMCRLILEEYDAIAEQTENKVTGKELEEELRELKDEYKIMVNLFTIALQNIYTVNKVTDLRLAKLEEEAEK